MKSVLVNLKWKLGAFVFYVLVCACGMLLAHSTGPLPGRTGDFGEPNCTGCHTSFPLNSVGGTLTISGVPAHYTPGQTYPITVTISKSGQTRWGFELSARIVTGAVQGGTLIASDATNTQIKTQNNIQYIEHTQAGTQAGAGQGSWTFNWKAPDTAAGAIRFSAAGNAANGNGSNQGDFIYTVSVTTDSTILPVTALFAHVAIGGGDTTIFSLANTGSDAVAGNLILTRADGTPLTVTLSSLSATGAEETVVAASTSLTIPPGGTKIVKATTSDPNQTLTGWARVESSGGQLSGVATFQYREGSVLKTAVGVLSSELEDSVTIPVDDDSSVNRFTGYAVANPGTDTLRITIFLANPNGVVTRTLSQAITLGPGEQTAGFLYQALNDLNFKFQGSVVLKAEVSGRFASVALVQYQEPNVLFTAIPVISGKSSGIGN